MTEKGPEAKTEWEKVKETIRHDRIALALLATAVRGQHPGKKDNILRLAAGELLQELKEKNWTLLDFTNALLEAKRRFKYANQQMSPIPGASITLLGILSSLLPRFSNDSPRE